TNDIMMSIFTDLDIRKMKKGTRPIGAVLAQRLIKAGEQLEEESIGDPLVVAELQNRLAKTLISLGHSQEAIPLLLNARHTFEGKLGTDNLDTLQSMRFMAMAYRETGKLDLATKLYEETVRLQKANLGARPPNRSPGNA